MEKRIEHRGTIINIEGRHVSVRIVQTSACASCQVKAMCASAESKEKVVDVWCDDTSSLTVGREVTVCGEMSMGRDSVLIAFGLPLVLVVVWVVVALQVLCLSELAAIGGVAVWLTAYFIVLYLLRSRLARRFLFHLRA